MITNNLFQLFLSILILAMLFPSCEEPEKITKSLQIKAGTPVDLDYRVWEKISGLGKVTIALYSTKKDWILKENPIYEGETDEEGYLEIPDFPHDTIWNHSRFDTLSNLRFDDVHIRFPTNTISSPTQKVRRYEIRLSTTPTRWLISLQGNTGGHNEFIVQLYLSEEDFLQETTPEYTPEALGIAYGNFGDAATQATRNELIRPIFRKTTDVDNVVVFDNLEPRKYWYKVYTPDGLPLESTENQLIDPLPDNPNLTTITEIILL